MERTTAIMVFDTPAEKPVEWERSQTARKINTPILPLKTPMAALEITIESPKLSIVNGSPSGPIRRIGLRP